MWTAQLRLNNDKITETSVTLNYWEIMMMYLMETINKMRRETKHAQRNTNGMSGDEKYLKWKIYWTGLIAV